MVARFWLLLCDALERVGLFGSPLYNRCLQRAADATEWGQGADCGEGEPF